LHGFVRAASGTFTSFDAPGAVVVRNRGTLPFAIDEGGDVTGMYLDAQDAIHGFVRSASGTITDFDVSGAGTSFLQGTLPLSMNSSGVITGLELDPNSLIHGFMRAADGTITTFDVPGAGTNVSESQLQLEGSGGFSINDSGEIAGSYLDSSSVSHGFVYAATQTAPSFTVSGTSVSVAPGATAGNASTITLTPGGGFTGNVALTAAITSSPTGAQDPPSLSFGSTTPVDITGTGAGKATLTILTTAATTGALTDPRHEGRGWRRDGGVFLACMLLFGVRAWRRSWRKGASLLALLVILVGGLAACGGGGSTTGSGNSGTTAGTYTVTVTGTSGATVESSTVTLTVQ
jgi:hypothetical protein